MNPRRYLPLIIVLTCAALLAGCGSSGSSSSNTGTTATTGSTAASTSTSTTSSSQTSSTPAAPAGGAEVNAEIAECKQIIGSQTKLPSSAKAKLENACAQAAKGNKQAVKVAAREICEEVIDKSAVPDGSAKEEALKTCRK